MRKSTRVAVFLLLLNASATAVVQSGVANDWGVDPNPGMDEAIQDLEEAMGNIDPTNFGDTLFGLYTSVTSAVEVIFNFVFYGPIMFQNLGVPDWATGVFFAPQYLFVGTDIVFVLSGRDV
jgi:hypothetical protein